MQRKLLVVIGAYPDVGKGLFMASCGYSLKLKGFRVGPLKFDGYLNFDSGNMNPYHLVPLSKSFYSEEEVFVLKDGFEGDVDSGYYERFMDIELEKDHNMTNGKLLNIAFETLKKNGGGLLKFSNIKEEMKKWIIEETKNNDITLLEIGGTIGDEESIWLYECISRMGRQEILDIQTVMLAPYLEFRNDKEKYLLSYRTKIIREKFLLAEKLGLCPSAIILRTSKGKNILKMDKSYINSDCGIHGEDIYFESDHDDIYNIPGELESQGFIDRVIRKFNLKEDKKQDNHLRRYVNKKLSCTDLIRIGILGKTMSYDSYVSLVEALTHAATSINKKLMIEWIDELTDNALDRKLKSTHGLILFEGKHLDKQRRKSFEIAYREVIPILALSHSFNFILFNEILKEKYPSRKFFKVGDGTVYLNKDISVKSVKNKASIKERFRCNVFSFDYNKIGKDWNITGLLDNKYPAIIKSCLRPYCVLALFHPEYKSRPSRPSSFFLDFLKESSLTKPSYIE